jgi:hypothetical protein
MNDDEKMDNSNAVEERKPSLMEQARLLARADAELRHRARREQLRIMADYRERVAAIVNDYKRKCSENLALLDEEHRQNLQLAEDQLRAELAEHEQLTVKLSRIT